VQPRSHQDDAAPNPRVGSARHATPTATAETATALPRLFRKSAAVGNTQLECANSFEELCVDGAGRRERAAKFAHRRRILSAPRGSFLTESPTLRDHTLRSTRARRCSARRCCRSIKGVRHACCARDSQLNGISREMREVRCLAERKVMITTMECLPDRTFHACAGSDTEFDR